MTEKYKIATCGLSCDICDGNTTKLQDNANYLLDVLKDPMFSGIISMSNPKSNFTEENKTIFNNMLEELRSFPPCPGCDKNVGCSIKQCAQEKKVNSCAKCDNFNMDEGTCTAVPIPQKSSFGPPAPIYFGFLSKRYQNRNVKNLQAIAKGKEKDVELWIEDMIKKGKTSRDLIDTTVNLFEMMKK
ncbi:MAG: DUF3795 domain-containing protein [Candidatus Hermodarchaeota archaeon]